MKFTKPWKALVEGDKYETDFFSGDDVPASLQGEAVKAGVADAPKVKAPKPKKFKGE